MPRPTGLSTEARARVVKATVRLPERGGRGVLVPGGLVLTATHCIGWEGSAGLVLGDHHPVRVEAGGHKFRLGPVYADAVSDMAALGPLDNQEFPDDEDAFDRWRDTTKPVQLAPWIPKPRRWSRGSKPTPLEPTFLPVNLLSLRGGWLRGKVTYWGFEPCRGRVMVQAEQLIEGGMSGGPVVDDRGRMVGVVSWGTREGAIPLARLSLPGWVIERTGTVRAR